MPPLVDWGPHGYSVMRAVCRASFMKNMQRIGFSLVPLHLTFSLWENIVIMGWLYS